MRVYLGVCGNSLQIREVAHLTRWTQPSTRLCGLVSSACVHCEPSLFPVVRCPRYSALDCDSFRHCYMDQFKVIEWDISQGFRSKNYGFVLKYTKNHIMLLNLSMNCLSCNWLKWFNEKVSWLLVALRGRYYDIRNKHNSNWTWIYFYFT